MQLKKLRRVVTRFLDVKDQPTKPERLIHISLIEDHAQFERAIIALKVRFQSISNNCTLLITPFNQMDRAYLRIV